MKWTWIAVLLLWLPSVCGRPDAGARLFPHRPPTRACGLSFVAPPAPFPKNPMPAVKKTGANWIAVIPYAYTRAGEPRVNYNESEWQWWGEKPEGCRKTVELAKAAGLNVMLKPQVYVPRSWTGHLDFPSAADWEKWEAEYQAYILPMAELAQQHDVELFCIGTEFKIGSRKRPAFWRALIRKIRTRYDGKLVYAANWDEYQQVPFWDELDYIGINAYFPLVDAPTPAVAALKKAWTPHLEKLKAFSEQIGRPVLFTEYGYLSVDGCAYNTWELEGRIRSLDINEQAQANALQACFETFFVQPFWAGGFLWKWFPNMQGHEGYPAKDYTPQGKKAAEVLSRFYRSNTRQ